MHQLSITPCEAGELKQQINYLKNTPVKGLSDLLKQGELQLGYTFINSIDALGALKTEFGAIDTLAPQSCNGEKKFLVSDIYSALCSNPSIDDGGLLQSIEEIRIAESNNEVEFNITALFQNNELVIKDGNKRTIAFYENRRNSHPLKMNFKLFVAWFSGKHT